MSAPAPAAHLVDLCGTYPRAVASIVAVSRAAWSCVFDHSEPGGRRRRAALHTLPTETFRISAHQALTPYTKDPSAALALLLEQLEELKLVRERRDGVTALAFAVLLPTRLTRDLLRGVRPYQELRFFVARAIRRHYDCALSSRAADLFHLLSDAVNSLMADTDSHPRRRLHYHDDVLPALRAALERSVPVWAPPDAGLALFLECCRMVDYLQPAFDVDHVVLRASTLDPEFMLSRLFGVPSGIEGFDELFGGGGIMLVDDADVESRPLIRGRTALVVGRYATGKSLLALQMAVAVAAKGGVAWVMPLEQSAEECLYTLRSMCKLPLDGSVVIATDPESARECLTKHVPDRGALILLRTVKESFDEFVNAFLRNVNSMSRYRMRLVIVDPINALHREEPSSISRGKMLSMFEQAKNSGANVWLIAEEGSGADDHSALFEQNITDTVIRLSLHEKHGDIQRYLEVTKSRLQREQRGKHPYNIASGQGIILYPSSSAVSERLASRRVRQPDTKIEFGFEPLNEILGRDAIRAGDVIVLQGPAGSLKAPIGLMFLLHAKDTSAAAPQETALPYRQKGCNLLITAREDETVSEWLQRHNLLRRAASRFRQSRELRVRTLRTGFIQPGYVLHRIERELVSARIRGLVPERVMITQVAEWERSCPYIREDETFVDALIDLLRRYGVTTLLTCSPPQGHDGPSMQQSIADKADCVIHFERIEFRGANRVVLRIERTRSMTHRAESFELLLTPDGIEVKPISPLLRVLHDGNVAPVDVRLFLHAETDMQDEYNKAVLNTVKSVLSRTATLDSERRLYFDDAFTLAASSAVDELQLLQLDEFQIPRDGGTSHVMLESFPVTALDESDWTDYFPRQVVRGGNAAATFSVLPFYENVSLLAYRRDRIQSPDVIGSWDALAAACRQWENDHPSEDDAFFEFPGWDPENFNCLYFEILLSISKPEREGCAFTEWVSGANAVTAAKLFRTVCRRAYLRQPKARADGLFRPTAIDMGATAVVWRTWYSTLNQLLSRLTPKERLYMEVAPLPQNVTIAGEWYLGVPRHSAAPDVGLVLMKHLTTKAAELDRMKLGVGLPTRQSAYLSTTSGPSARVSPYFSMDPKVLGDLIRSAFPRSSFDCYSNIAGVLSAHLQSVIEIPTDEAAEHQIPSILASLHDRIEFVLGGRQCVLRTGRQPRRVRSSC